MMKMCVNETHIKVQMGKHLSLVSYANQVETIVAYTTVVLPVVLYGYET